MATVKGKSQHTNKVNFYAIIIWTLIIGSIMIRFINIEAPLLDMYNFRQTQTAITVRSFIEEGVSFLRYQTPVLGEPWTLPMEFPLFQFCAFVVFKIFGLFGIVNLDIAMRVTSILFFYGSAWYLYQFVSHYFDSKKIAIVSLLVYLYSPFVIYWSRTSMIEYAACFFSLGYLFYTYDFLKRQDKKSFILSIAMGVLGYLTKSTTMIPICIFLGLVIVQFLIEKKFYQMEVLRKKENYIFISKIAILVLLPVIPGIWWLKFSDQLKIQSGYQALSSEALTTWNFGTWEQKTTITNWTTNIAKSVGDIIPKYILGALCLSVPFIYRKKKELISCLWLVVACVGTIFICFNLYYVHYYYFCAISPFICMFAGILIYTIGKNVFQDRNSRGCAGIMAVLLLITTNGGTEYFRFIRSNLVEDEAASILQLTDYVRETTQKEDKMIVFGDDWNSRIPYYAQRKALMVWKPAVNRPMSDYIDSYTTVIARNKMLKNDVTDLTAISPLSLEASIGDWNVYSKADFAPSHLQNTEIYLNAHIDLAYSEENVGITLSGWAYVGSAQITQIYLKDRGGNLYPAIYGVYRPDVNTYFNDESGNYCGFDAFIPMMSTEEITEMVAVYEDDNGIYTASTQITFPN